jgi:ABC-type sugar transport system permease subunit
MAFSTFIYIWLNKTHNMNTIDTEIRENPNTPILKPALRYALILSGIGIGLTLLSSAIKWDPNSWDYKLVSWAFTIGAMVFIIKHFRDTLNGGFLRLGQGVGLSALTGLFQGLIMCAFMYVYLTSLNPEMLVMIEDQTLAELEKQGMSESEIDQAMAMTKPFLSAGFISGMMIFGSVIMTTLLGLIISAIMKKGE